MCVVFWKVGRIVIVVCPFSLNLNVHTYLHKSNALNKIAKQNKNFQKEPWFQTDRIDDF